jgi:hypothetical protein
MDVFDLECELFFSSTYLSEKLLVMFLKPLENKNISVF